MMRCDAVLDLFFFSLLCWHILVHKSQLLSGKSQIHFFVTGSIRWDFVRHRKIFETPKSFGPVLLFGGHISTEFQVFNAILKEAGASKGSSLDDQ